MAIDNVIGEELERVRLANKDGMLIPAEVVAAARDKKSPLHGRFTWDNKEAADKWREDEARNLIRAYVTYEPRVARQARGYISLPTDRIGGGGYRKTGDVIDNPNLVDQLIEEVRAKLTSLRGVYTHIKVLDPLWLQIEADVALFMTRQAGRDQAA